MAGRGLAGLYSPEFSRKTEPAGKGGGQRETDGVGQEEPSGNPRLCSSGPRVEDHLPAFLVVREFRGRYSFTITARQPPGWCWAEHLGPQPRQRAPEPNHHSVLAKAYSNNSKEAALVRTAPGLGQGRFWPHLHLTPCCILSAVPRISHWDILNSL